MPEDQGFDKGTETEAAKALQRFYIAGRAALTALNPRSKPHDRSNAAIELSQAMDNVRKYFPRWLK